MKKQILSCIFTITAIVLVGQQSYYNDVDLTKTGIALKNELATKIINTHTRTLSYDGAKKALKIVDLQPNQSTNVYLLYGFSDDTCVSNTANDNDHKLRAKSNFGAGSSCEWNREHTFPKALGNPNLGTSGAGADAHHLRAADVERNRDRDSNKFASGSGNSGASNGGWYPGDEWKGDVARMMMYMYLRYGNQCKPTQVGIGSSSSTPDDMIDLFLQWNAQDPVSPYEDQRNEYLGDASNSYGQGNRNPFIDNPYLATQIWGGPIAQNRWGSTPTDTEAPTVPTNLSVSNETSSSIDLSWTASTDNVAVTSYEVFVDGVFKTTSTTTSVTVTGLTATITYSFTVRAKDAANNVSAQSVAVNGTTASNNNGGNTGTHCANETFSNIGSPSSSYATISWTGDNNFTWNAVKARTDQGLNGKAITLGKGTTSSITSASVSGGISSFTVTTKRVFSGSSGTYELLVNGTKVGDISYSATQETVIVNNINVSGNVIISIKNNSNTNNRVVFDDLSWECYSTASTNNYTLADVSVYPNPSKTGKIFVNIPSNVSVNTIKVYSILGKEVYSVKNLIDKTYTINQLKSGIYILKISSNNQSVTKKLIVN